MLVALNADPKRCGYNSDQIQGCLTSISTKGVHQESAGARQLIYMLNEKGFLKKSELKIAKLKTYPEILMLRFDKERSPMDGIPLDIRESLYRIYLDHADGAVNRSGRTWKSFYPLVSQELTKSYAFDFEDPCKKTGFGKSKTTTNEDHIWESLKWPEIQERLKLVDMAILPVGSIEQHGPHLPLDTDAFDANYLAHKVAQACSDPKPFILPLIAYGVSYEHDDFPGTISVSNDSLSLLVYEIGMSVVKQGITKLVIINGHGGNGPALNFAAQKINRDARIFVCVDTGETSDVDIYKILETPNDIHAGEAETSTSLAVRPEIVSINKAEKLVPEFSSRYLDFTSKRGVSWYSYTKRFSLTGVIGDPTKASAEKGNLIWQAMIAHLVALIEDVKHLSLDEIFQRKY